VLVGFAPVWLDAGETAEVSVAGSLRPTQRWVDGGFRPAERPVRLEASSYAGDPAAVTVELTPVLVA
jgi:hypothetical protein